MAMWRRKWMGILAGFVGSAPHAAIDRRAWIPERNRRTDPAATHQSACDIGFSTVTAVFEIIDVVWNSREHVERAVRFLAGMYITTVLAWEYVLWQESSASIS